MAAGTHVHVVTDTMVHGSSCRITLNGKLRLKRPPKHAFVFWRSAIFQMLPLVFHGPFVVRIFSSDSGFSSWLFLAERTTLCRGGLGFGLFVVVVSWLSLSWCALLSICCVFLKCRAIRSNLRQDFCILSDTSSMLTSKSKNRHVWLSRSHLLPSLLSILWRYKPHRF